MIKLKDLIPESNEVDVDYELGEDYYDMIYHILNAYKQNPKGRQYWKLAKYNRMKKIWNDYVKLGIVRDEKGLDGLCDILEVNTLKLAVNTMLTGHTAEDPDEYFDEHGIDKDEFYDSNFIKDDSGNYRISDYGVDKLIKILSKLKRAKTYENKLLLADQMLNVIHMRSDLSSWFIEGGRKSLDDLGGQTHDD
jgi:hypothetical protein